MKKHWWRKKIIWIVLLLIAGSITLLFLIIKSWLGDLWLFSSSPKELLGFNGGKNYLVVFQNNNELRPTGGFISTYGLLKIKNGKLTLEPEDAYNLQKTEQLSPAPKPFQILLAEDLKFKGYYFRDGNFEVNFEDSAKTLEKLFNQQSGKEAINFDGVFAINFEFLEDVISIYNLKVDGIELTKNNLFTLLEHETKNIDIHNEKLLEERKSFLKDLSKELIKQMTSSVWKYKQLFAEINKALDQKKILLFFKNEQLQEIVKTQKWSGNFNPADYKNFIYSNTANIGGRKGDRYLRKTHQYFVSFDENGKGTVKYQVNFEHLGTINLNSDTYKAYLRVFVPKGSKFISAEGEFFEDRSDFPEGEYFEAYLKMEPGEKRAITFDYQLPPEISMENFSLDLIKQPGTNDFWQIAIQLPSDNSLEEDNFTSRENLSFWAGFPDTDRHFKFNYLKDKLPPLVLWQKFHQQNAIEIFFSEPIEYKIARNLKNYEIKDLNYINNQEDKIKIKKVELDEYHLLLHTEGISKAEEERYEITLKNFKDKYGNTTQPAILKLTLVQRL